MSTSYVYVSLSNQHRQDKRQGNKLKKKTDYQLYMKQRLTIDWRIVKFRERLGFNKGLMMEQNLSQMNSVVRDNYLQFQNRTRKYWGGGPYFKKLGRMDKVKLKSQIQIKMSPLEKLMKILHKLESQYFWWRQIEAFEGIKSCKKCVRNFEFICDKNMW